MTVISMSRAELSRLRMMIDLADGHTRSQPARAARGRADRHLDSVCSVRGHNRPAERPGRDRQFLDALAMEWDRRALALDREGAFFRWPTMLVAALSGMTGDDPQRQAKYGARLREGDLRLEGGP
ncbi:MAG: hypothetical protein AB1942_23000 [Pseudomonadota bacterium]